MISEEKNNSLEIKIYEKAFRNETDISLIDKYQNKLRGLYDFQNKFLKENNCKLICIIYKSELPLSNTKLNYRNVNDKKTIIQLDLNGNKIKEFESIKQASKLTGINKAYISMVANKKGNTSGGYKWEFKH